MLLIYREFKHDKMEASKILFTLAAIAGIVTLLFFVNPLGLFFGFNTVLFFGACGWCDKTGRC